MAAEELPIEQACRVLDVSVSGGRLRLADPPPSARALRHAWLAEITGRVHTDSRGTYGAKRVHAELVLGHGIAVGREQVALVMRRAGLQGLSGRPRYRRVPNLPTAGDLVDRQFTRNGPDQLWVPDIERHEALLDRVEVKGLRPWAVAAARWKLGAA